MLTLGGLITVWEIYALAVIGGVVAALDGPARHALVFQMVGPDDLPNAVALTSSLGTTARVLGPAIGGLVVAFAGPGVAFAINAASYLVIIVCLLALDTSRSLARAPRPRGDRARRRRRLAPLHRQLAPRARRLRRRLRALDLLVQLQRAAAARRRPTLHSGAQVFGLIAAVFGAGALCGAMINATVAQASLACCSAARPASASSSCCSRRSTRCRSSACCSS